MTPIIKKQVVTGDYALIYDYLPSDNSKQTYAMKEIITILNNQFRLKRDVKVLDLGCGDGNSFSEFSKLEINVNWLGLEIKDSPEMANRKINDFNILIFDGINIPLGDNSIDIILSRQVLEHTRYPEKLLCEVYRVLKTGGYLIGSTSHLEPFHSRSLWNFTPYGFIMLLRSAGFKKILIRPGIDGITLIIRRLLGFLKIGNLINVFFRFESPLNFILEILLKFMRIGVIKRNAVKLIFSGHIIFIAINMDIK